MESVQPKLCSVRNKICILKNVPEASDKNLLSGGASAPALHSFNRLLRHQP